MTIQTSLRFMNAAHFLDHFFLLIFPTAVIALHAEWDLSYADALAYGTSAFAAFAIGTLPAGWLGDRWSRTGMICVFFIGIGLSSILTGMAQGPLTLATGLAALGLFAAIFHPVGLALVSGATERPGHALAVNGVWGNMGLAAAALVTGLVTEMLDWRMAFILPGAASIAIGFCYLALLRRSRNSGVSHTSRGVALLPASGAERMRVFALILAAALFGGLIFNGVTVSLPKLFEERLSEYAQSLSEVGTAAAIVFALAAFAQLPVGRMLDQYGARPILLTLLAIECVCLAAIAQAQGALAFIWAAPLLLVIFGALPVTGWLMAHYVPQTWRARAFAVEYVISLGVGSLAVPMISIFHEYGGFVRLFLLLALFSAIVLAAALLLPKRRVALAPAE